MERRYGINPSLTGRWAECDGGMMVAVGPQNVSVGAREHFRGRLTGEYFEEGDPPWRWYLLTDLADKPSEFSEDFVWCEKGFVFLMDGHNEDL